MNRWNDGRGSITAFVAAVATALVLPSRTSSDGVPGLHAHHPAPDAADQGARAAAPGSRPTNLRQTNEPRLDPGDAETAALDYLARVGATGTALVDGADITVTVTRVQPLRVLPGADRTITVTETASAVRGDDP